jgi:ABC-type amino acid transport substrate-binding protein
MDDERIQRALRQGPVDEPGYEPRGIGGRPLRSGPRLPWLTRPLQLTATVIAVLLVIAGVVVVRNTRLPGVAASPSPSSGPSAVPSLLDQVRSRRVLRVAVAPTYPQVQVTGGVYDGFDISVARALGAALNLPIDVSIVTEAEIEAGGWNGRWDVAFGVPAVSQRLVDLRFGQTYARWPGLVVLPAGGTATSLTALAGRTACVAAGSIPFAWLQGRPYAEIGESVATPPRAAKVTVMPSEEACLSAGGWDFAVTDRSTQVTLAATAGLRALDSRVFLEPVAPAVDAAGPDPTTLLAAFDTAVRTLQSSGTLSSLSKQQLGGIDLSVQP